MILFVCGARYFGSVQSIWVDETTQLSGIALSYADLVNWLISRDSGDMGVPPDRMPPLSFWIGRLWASGFGFSEMSMRWLGIAAVIGGAPAIYLIGRRVGGAAGGAFAIAFIFAGPLMMAQAVEIRTYPLFFCASAWAVFAYVRVIQNDGAVGRWWIVLVLSLGFAGYLHFFGLPLGACLLASLLIHRLWYRLPLRPLALSTLGFAALWLGIAPFVLASIDPADPGATGSELYILEIARQIARLGFRQIFHPVLLASPVILVIGTTAFLGLLTSAIFLLLRRGAEHDDDPFPLYALLPLTFAFGGLASLQALLTLTGRSSIDALVPHYNIWLLPLVVLLLSSAFRRVRNGFRIATVCALILIGAKLTGTYLFLKNAITYTHGAAEWVADAIQEPDSTLIIHEAEGAWGSIFFPINFLTEQRATQWLRQANGEISQFTPDGLQSVPDPVIALASFDRIIEVDARIFDSRQLGSIASGVNECGFATQLGSSIDPEIAFYCAYFAAARRITDRTP